MTYGEFANALARLGWSVRHVLHMTGRDGNSGSNWLRAGAPPAAVAEWIQRRVDAHDAMMRDDPPPGKTNKRKDVT